MTLLTSFYFDPDAHRRREFLECVRRNQASGCFDEICLWVEGSADLEKLATDHPFLADRSVRLIAHDRRLTYRNFFAYANQCLGGRTVVIANADIFFDETLKLLAASDLAGRLLCLSRWDVQADGSVQLFDHPASQDAWIFQAPICEFTADFWLGLPGCDNRLAWEARNAGLQLSNPARSIRACHLHLSGVRRYTAGDRVQGQGSAVPLEFLAAPNRVNGAHQRAAEIPRPVSAGVDTIFAVTSLSPAPWRVPAQKAAINSWRAAGLRVCSFNHPSEIAELGSRYDVEWVPVEATSAEIFGRHYIPVNAVVDWAAGRDATFLLINSDIELRVTAWEMKRIRWLSDGGLCYVVRHNHRGNETAASPEPHGIDAFLFHGRDAGLVPGSFLSIGQPFWDYYLPHLFATAGRDISTLDFRAAYHRDHGRQWSWENWHRCALEFHRVTGSLGSDSSVNACLAMSQSVRRTFDRQRKLISAQPMMIRDWVTQKFGHPAAKTFLELGSHLGTDTAWMAALPNVTIHAFEPDPRNRQPARSNVIQHQLAIAGSDDRVPFNLSLNGWGQEWTYSSSIKQPKNHLHHYPVTFGETVEVETITLDTYRRQAALEHIDLIWADIQGAEGEMISGGAETLRRTRYLFTEYSDDEMYEGQVSLGEIVRMLPGFRIVELWPDDVLLENRALVP